MTIKPSKIETVGWVSKMGVESEEYAWLVRCLAHPPEQGVGWEEISAGELPLMLSSCEICQENLV